MSPGRMNILMANDFRQNFRLLALSTCLSIAMFAADWPMFGRTPERNMVAAETGLPDHFVPGKPAGDGSRTIDLAGAENVAWAIRLGSQTFGMPTVAAGRLLVGTARMRGDPRYSGDRGEVLCLDASTGREQWRLSMHRQPNHTNLPGGARGNMPIGVCTSATLRSDRAWVGDWRCNLLCLDLKGQADGNAGPFTDEAAYCAAPGKPPAALTAADGDIVWRYDITAELGILVHDAMAAGPVLLGNRLWCITGNGVSHPNHGPCTLPDAPSIIVLDAETGKPIARDHAGIGRHVLHGDWSTPASGVIAGRQLVVHGGGDGVCHAFDAEPVPAADGGLGSLAERWRFDCNRGVTIPYKKSAEGPSEIIASPVIHGDRVYVAIGQDWSAGRGRGGLFCIDGTQTGDIVKPVWQYLAIARSLGTPSIADGLLYIADLEGRLHCLDAATGTPVWVEDLGQPVYGSTLVADGKLYVVGSRGRVFIYAAGREPRRLCQVDLKDQACSGPIAANGMVYIATSTMLYALKAGVRAPDSGHQR